MVNNESNCSSALDIWSVRAVVSASTETVEVLASESSVASNELLAEGCAGWGLRLAAAIIVL